MSNTKMTRQRNTTWYPPNEWQYVNLQVLMDIREELQALNRLLGCSNVARGFIALQRIAKQDEAAFKRRVDAAARKRAKRKANG